MRKCELCKSMARVYCDSDRARLCWTCDAKVHSANFLVARHLRSLLCHICQSPTPWSASGETLCPSTASVCGRCGVEGVSGDDDDREERVGGNDGEIGTDSDDEYERHELQLEDSVDENDNQVVPWSSTPPSHAASPSRIKKVSVGDGGVLRKRKRQNVSDLTSQEDELDCSSVNINRHTPSSPTPELASEDEMTSFHATPWNSKATVGKLKRFRHQNVVSGDDVSTPVRWTSKSTRNAQMDLNSPDLP